MTTDRQDMTPAPVRIDVWRALKALLFTLVIPLTTAFVVDYITGLLPVLTIVAVVVFIPLGTIVVGRIVLGEFNRVIAIVAPEPIAADVEEGAAPVEEQAGSDGVGNRFDALEQSAPIR